MARYYVIVKDEIQARFSSRKSAEEYAKKYSKLTGNSQLVVTVSNIKSFRG